MDARTYSGRIAASEEYNDTKARSIFFRTVTFVATWIAVMSVQQNPLRKRLPYAWTHRYLLVFPTLVALASQEYVGYRRKKEAGHLWMAKIGVVEDPELLRQQIAKDMKMVERPWWDKRWWW